jgi:hypothetical protein
MLISLDHLIKKYELKINGISHFGAHLGQEIDTYLKNNIKNIHLFEPQSKIFNQLINCNHMTKMVYIFITSDWVLKIRS